MKYIVFEDFSGQAIPILFPDRIEHGELREQMPYSTVLAAGYVNHSEKGFVCHGQSKALEASSRPEDPAIIERHFQQGEA